MTAPQHPNHYDDEDEIDLFELWATVAANKKTIGLFTLVFATLATLAAFIMTPVYEADVVIGFADDSGGASALSSLASQYGGLAEMAGISLGGDSAKDTYLAYLKSRDLAEGFIGDNNLIPVIFYKDWDTEKKRWDIKDPDDIPTEWDAYKRFSEKIMDVQQDKKTGIITLSIKWKDRLQAVAWANALVQRANAKLREKAINDSQKTLTYLKEELQKTNIVEVQQTIYRVMESQIKTMMLANTNEQFAFKVIDPARPVDEDEFVKPKRPLIIALGTFGGLFLGVLFVFFRQAVRNRKEAEQTVSQ